jgi:hypothetical protein
MPTVTIDTTLIERPTLYGNTTGYNVNEVIAPNVATAAAGGAGQSVTTSIAASEKNLPASLNYTIEAMPSVACAVSYANKTTEGFDIIQTPLTSGVTLAAGTMDVKITWDKE